MRDRAGEQETEVPVGYDNFRSTVGAADRDRLLKEVSGYLNERISKPKKLRGGLFYLETFPRKPTGKLMCRNLPARLEITRKSKL